MVARAQKDSLYAINISYAFAPERRCQRAMKDVGKVVNMKDIASSAGN